MCSWTSPVSRARPWRTTRPQAVRDVVARTPAPPGVKAYVTGPAAIVADMGSSGDRTVILITVVSLAVIFTMLLLVYRSVITVILLLLMVGIELQVARGIVAFLGDHGIIGLTTFAINLLVSIGIAAGTDYGIFFFGRYQEARQAGEDRETAYYTTYHGVAKIVLASGLTIAGALFCLKFTRLPHFQALAVPCALGVIVAVAVALTLVPAVLHVGSRFGLFDPKRKYHGTWMAANRHGDRSVAGAHSPRDISGRAYRAIDAAGIQTQLQRHELYAEKYPRRAGVRGRKATFSSIANDVARDPDGRGRSRSAKFGRCVGIEQTSQGCPRGSRHFQSAGLNSARGHPDRAHIDTVYAQHAKRRAATKSCRSRKNA